MTSDSITETDTAVLPRIDLDLFRADPTSPAALAECEKAALALQTFGALVLSTSTVSDDSNTEFLDLFEDYFAQPDELLKKDERPQYGFQVGTTLSNTEKPKCHSNDECQSVISNLDPAERPLDLTASFADPKCRFFYRMAQIPPYQSKFSTAAMLNVVPQGFEDIWIDKCEAYGSLLKSAVEGLAEMSAIGFGLDKSIFLDAGKYGPHLLAPTATDLVKYGQLGAIFAGFHTDLNFLTIHGPSRYPGLHIWARNTGKRIVAKVPKGCLLVQAGKQLEIVTGGLVRAGFHEVIYNERTHAAVEQRKITHPDRPLIRISSTMFWHLSSDYDITPIPALAQRAVALRKKNGEITSSKSEDEDPYKEWRGVLVGNQVLTELGLINLVA
ncbi:Isopenicillin N synthase-like [Phaffia rhodozyma]|uniref:Isopenicillin N synthase-like n=1 Tax=Phaffia rhodozyma TaxID=264483 RepID=A0A0F7SFV6_PHARH|nr:Isopenicillin N synthase-like [Phaffia rhodozyma]